MLSSIHRLDRRTSKSIHAGLLYPSLTSIVCALALRSLQSQQVSHINIHIELGPEWQITCHDDSKVYRTSQDLFWKEVEASRLFFLAYLGVLDVQQGLRKHVQSGDVVIFSGLADSGLIGGDAPTSSIIVRDVFRNLPVRRKLLSNLNTIRSELGHCRKDVALLSLLNPQVHLSIYASTTDEQREALLLVAPRARSITSRYEQLFFLPVDDLKFATVIDTVFFSKEKRIIVKGFIVKTLLSSRSHQNIIVDGGIDKSEDREAFQESLPHMVSLKPFIRDSLHEILLLRERYHISDIESGRYYGYYLSIDTGNAKLTARDLEKGIKKVLQDAVNYKDEHEIDDEERSILQPTILEQGLRKRCKPDKKAAVTNDIEKPYTHTISLDRSSLRREPDSRIEGAAPEWLRSTLSNYYNEGQSSYSVNETSIPDLHQMQASHRADQAFTEDSLDRDGILRSFIVGQVDNKYICINYEGRTLVLIDQHAAHERVRLEAILCEYVDSCLKHDETARDENDNLYLGISIDNDISAIFGQDTVKAALQFWGFRYRLEESEQAKTIQFQAVPAILSGKMRQEQVLSSLVADLSVYYSQDDHYAGLRRLKAAISSINHGVVSKAKWLLALRHLPPSILNHFNLLSCRGAIMFNDPLSISQCQALVLQLAETNFPFQCAHGRPTQIPMCKLSQDLGKSPPLPIEWSALAIQITFSLSTSSYSM